MMKQLVTQDFCLKCRGCCRFKEADSVWAPTVLDEEEKLIPTFAISSNKKIRALPSAEKINNFICSFLNSQDNKCNIYEGRPFECRLYPFIINRKENKAFLALDLNCPFVKENIDSEGLKEYSRELAELLNSPRYKICFKDNPRIIQAYPEAANLIEINI